MATATSILTDRTVDVPLVTYPLDYSPRLVRTIDHIPEGYVTVEPSKADFYDTVVVAVRMTDPEMLASGLYLSPPGAGEEEAVYRKVSPGAKNLRVVEELRDYFAGNAWGWNTTGLRFREADLRRQYNVGDKVTAKVIETDITPFLSEIADQQFTRNNWKDIIDKVNHVKGELVVPYARGQVIRETDRIYGIFTKVELITEHQAPFALHGWLRENLDISQDPISGQYDVAVGRGCGWLRGEGCLYVDASCGRWGAYSDGGFRPVVRGSRPEGPKIEVVSANVDLGRIEDSSRSQKALLSADIEKVR